MTTKIRLLHDTVGIPTGAVAVTQSASDNTTKVATTAYVTTALANLADSAPSTLNTLNELAAALGDDANFSTTVTNSIAAKLPLAGGTLTGNILIDSSSSASIGLDRGNDTSGSTIDFKTAGTVKWYMGLRGLSNDNFYLRNEAGSTNAFTILTNGNVGIGVASPSSTLDIRGSGNVDMMSKIINTQQTSDGRKTEFLFGKDNGANLSGVLKYVYDTTQASRRIDLVHYQTTNGISILDGGNVGIGTTSASTPLHVRYSSAPNSGGNRNTVEDVLTLEATGYFPYGGYGMGINFQGEDYGNTAIRDYGKIQALMRGHSDQNSSGDPSFSSDLAFWTNTGGASNTVSTEKMRITSDGNVGIGTTDPKRPLQIGATGSFPISFNGNYPDIHMNTYYESGWRIHTAGFGAKTTFNGATGAFGFSNVASTQVAGATFTPLERLTILANGNVGIGTSSPSTYDSRSNNLVVGDSGDAGITIFSGATSNARLQFAPSGSTGLDNGLIDYDNNDDSMSFATGGTERLLIDSSGRVMIGTTTEGRAGEGADMFTIGSTGNNSGMTMRSGTSGYGSIYFSDGTSGTDEYKGYLQYGHATDVLHIAAGGSTIMNLKDGKVAIGGNFTPVNQLEIQGSGYDQIRIGSNHTDNTNKTCGIVGTTYTNQSVSVFQMFNQNGNNAVYYGSADGAHRGLQNHYFYVNTNYNSTSGHKLAYNIKASGGGGHEWHTQSNSNAKKLALHNGEGLWLYNNGGSGYSSYGTGAALRVTELSHNQSAVHYIEIGGNLPGYTAGQYNCLKTDLGDLHFAAGGTYTGYISSGGTFTDISDVREKENIATITNATAKLKQLRGVYHTWKDTENRGTDTTIGLIAQEVEAVVPEVVTTSSPTSLNTPASDTAGLKGVAYAKLVPLLIETIKELEARITTLEG